jgi:hypothetical protein
MLRRVTQPPFIAGPLGGIVSAIYPNFTQNKKHEKAIFNPSDFGKYHSCS